MSQIWLVQNLFFLFQNTKIFNLDIGGQMQGGKKFLDFQYGPRPLDR